MRDCAAIEQNWLEYGRQRACQETPLDKRAAAMQTRLSTYEVLLSMMMAEKQERRL